MVVVVTEQSIARLAGGDEVCRRESFSVTSCRVKFQVFLSE